jgi:multidrug efflux system membrane fusion protein
MRPFPTPRPLAFSLGLAALCVAVLLAGCSRNEAAPEPVRAVRTVVVGSDAAGTTLEFAAEVRARTESRLGFRVGGKLVRRNADLGDAVKAGQVLAQLDPQDLRLGQDAARASLAAAQANHEQAAADFKRFKELREQGFISSAELERRETALKAAKATLDQAQAQASVQGNQTAYSALVADASGVITGVEAEPGQVVAAGTPVLRLAHDGPRDVVFSVPEDKLQLLRGLEGKSGQLKVKLWGSNELWSASVREVAAAADPVTRTFLVKADVGRAAVKLGQTASITLDLPKTNGVNKLPLSALMEYEGKTAVWLLDKESMTVRPQVVQVAGAEANSAVISSGLTPGQVVVTAGAHVLTPGQKVKFYGATAATPVAAAASR